MSTPHRTARSLHPEVRPWRRSLRASERMDERGSLSSGPPAGARRTAPATPLASVPSAPRRLFIVEDHPVVREGYALLFRLAPDLDVAGMAVSGEEALDTLFAAAPDLVLIDMALPGMNGLDLVERLHARDATLRMLVVSGQARQVYEARALAAGAVGFVSKDDGPEALLVAIRSVLDGAPPS